MADTKISDLPAVTDVIATDEYVLARSGATNKIDASDLLVADNVAFTPAGTIAATDVQAAIEEVASEAGGGGLFDAYAYLRDEKAANTEGGTFTSAAWQTRVLNTEVFDPAGIVSLSSNQFTLAAAGTYLVKALAPAYRVDRHKAKLRNMTASSDVAVGSSEVNANSNLVVTSSVVIARFTIAGSATFELQHRCETTGTTTGFGLASNFAVTEVYSEVEIWREG